MKNSPELADLIFNTIDSVVVIVDGAGAVVRMNPCAEHVTGYRTCEVMGKPYWSVFVAADEQAAGEKRFAMLLSGEWPLNYECEWTSRDGTRRQIRWSIGILRDAGGRVETVVGTGTDITYSRRAESALRDQTRMLRSVLDSVGDGVAVVDQEGEFLVYTAELERIVGRPQPMASREEWPRYFGFFLPDGVTSFPAANLPMSRAMKGEDSNEVEILIRRPDWPEPRWCSVNGRPLRDESGRVRGGVIASRDITDRKRTEGEIRFRKSLLESQMEASIDGVLVVDESGKILLSNSRFAKIMGVPDDVVRKGIDEDAIAATLQQVQDPDEFMARIRWLYQHSDEQSRDEIRLKDGRVIDRFSTPVRTPEREGSPMVHYGRLWIFRDITDLKNAEAAARQSAQVAYRNEVHFRQLAEHTRRLAREIDHRVGNNLAALLGLVSVTRTRVASVDAFADAIQNRLLAMAKVHQLLREGNWKRVALAELISSVHSTIVQPHARVRFIASGPEVWIEPRQVSPLTMVLVELLTNSAKHGVYGASGGNWRSAGRPCLATREANPHASCASPGSSAAGRKSPGRSFRRSAQNWSRASSPASCWADANCGTRPKGRIISSSFRCPTPTRRASRGGGWKWRMTKPETRLKPE